MTTTTRSSYIDIPALSAATFNPYNYANTLVTTINPSTSEQIDLTTPLQRTLFDLQEIDTLIHNLTATRAQAIIAHTSSQNAAAQHIAARVEEERAKLVADYERLRKEVLERYERAEILRRTATNGLRVARLGAGVTRIMGLARNFEQVMVDAGVSASSTRSVNGGGVGVSSSSSGSASRTARDDPRVLRRACRDLLDFRAVMAGRDGADLGKLDVVRSVRGRVFEDGEAQLLDWARKIIRDFSVTAFVTGSMTASAAAATATAAVTGMNTYRETEEAKIRFEVACQVLYLLSPVSRTVSSSSVKDGLEAEYLVKALQTYLQNAVSSSAAGIARGLGQLPNLDRACSEVSGRCQNVIGFEVMLAQVTVPDHPSVKQRQSDTKKAVGNEHDEYDGDDSDIELDGLDLQYQEDMPQKTNVLELLLRSLDTNSLVSYFWRSLASSLSSRVQEIMNRGGVSARTLKSNRDMVRDEIRDCVARGSKTPAGLAEARSPSTANWEREAAVMVQSVMGPLNR